MVHGSLVDEHQFVCHQECMGVIFPGTGGREFDTQRYFVGAGCTAKDRLVNLDDAIHGLFSGGLLSDELR